MASHTRLIHRPPTSLLLFSPAAIHQTRTSLLRPTHLSALPHFRPFAITPSKPASARSRKNTQSHPSMRAAMASEQDTMQRSGEVLEYIGVVEGTLIMPRAGPKLPSWGSQTRERLRLEWRRLRTRALEFAQSHYTARYYVSPRVEVGRGKREAVSFARRVYVEMNTGFARGKLGRVGGELSAGFRANLEERIEKRGTKGTGVSLEWGVREWVEEPALASWRFVVIPGEKGRAKDEQHGIMQAVVRLVSRQSLIRTVDEDGEVRVRDERGGEIVGEAMMNWWRDRNTKLVTEYLVVQRLLKRGSLGPWRAWGTVEESSLESLAADEARLRAQYEAYKQRKGAASL